MMIDGCMLEILEPLLQHFEDQATSASDIQRITVCWCKLRKDHNEQYIFDGQIEYDLTRLQHICACAIMHNEAITRHSLPFIPVNLFIPILQAAILDRCYNGLRLELTDSLLQLIVHWPHEDFVLKDILPTLYLPNFKCLKSGYKSKLGCEYLHFYDDIIKLLPKELLNFSGYFNSQLKRIDLSGFQLQIQCSDATRAPYSIILSPKCLLGSVKNANNPNCPLGHNKLELICDAYIDGSDEENAKAVENVIEMSSKQGTKLTVKFRKIKMVGMEKCQIVSLLKALSKHETEFIEMTYSYTDDEVATYFSQQMQGLQLGHRSKLHSLEFLSNMSNLEQLDLSGTHLRNKLTPLNFLTKGLKFLNISKCNLVGEDMEIVSQSHHRETLLHFNISDNNFSTPLDISGLIELCLALISVKILEIEKCSLNELTPDLLNLFFESLAKIPKLSLLFLGHNDFSSNLLSNHIKGLHTCSALKVLYLTVPSHMYDDKDFCLSWVSLRWQLNFLNKFHLKIWAEIDLDNLDIVWQTVCPITGIIRQV